jgi:glutamate synthase (NADPH/NADH) small chain
MDHERLPESYEKPEVRISHSREFVRALSPEEAKLQAVRCMDCGIPFCSNGCPLHNIIPDFNDLVFNDQWNAAINRLDLTNNFPEFTGRVCPAPCEEACTLNIRRDPVGIKSIERAIIDQAWERGFVEPRPPAVKTGKRVAVVGSGPAGMACAQQLARAGHDVTVYEKNPVIGGLLTYGIPDFKLEKGLVTRRVQQMEAEGVVFKTGVAVGPAVKDKGYIDYSSATVTAQALEQEFDAVVLATGSENPRDLPAPGRELDGIHFAMEFLVQHNRRVAGQEARTPILAEGKKVVVIGGGDTGSDCVGTSNRQKAASIVQLEVMPKPPTTEVKELTWPYWPYRLRTSSSHEEGCERDWAVQTKRFVGDGGRVTAIEAIRVNVEDGKLQEMPGTEFQIPADLVLLAMGFTNPTAKLLDAFGIDKDARGNAKAEFGSYRTSKEKVFAAGDVRRGQSLVVWAIREGRDCAAAVDAWLLGR